MCSSDLIPKVAPTHLLHLAWAPSGLRMRDPAENQAWARASVSLFEAFSRAGGRRAVFAGSCAEYDWSHVVLNEVTTPSKPATVYGAAKNAVREAIAERQQERVAEEERAQTVAREQADRVAICEEIESLSGADALDRIAELRVRWDSLPPMPSEYAASLTRRCRTRFR